VATGDGAHARSVIERASSPSYQVMSLTAGAAAVHMHQSWRRPVRHNRQIERAALWNCLRLDLGCAAIIRHGLGASDGLGLEPIDRYQLHAAAYIVHHNLPYGEEERAELLPGDSLGQFEFPDEPRPGGREITLVERWHGWLWEQPEPSGKTPAVPSAVGVMVAEACSRIADALHASGPPAAHS
jgi:hypothetical protein